MNIDNLSDGILAWLLDIASNSPHARFVIVATNRLQLMRDVLEPIQDALGTDVRVSTTGPCQVFGRRVHIVTREEQLRGMAPRSILVHDWPDRNTHQYAEYALKHNDGQIHYALRG